MQGGGGLEVVFCSVVPPGGASGVSLGLVAGETKASRGDGKGVGGEIEPLSCWIRSSALGDGERVERLAAVVMTWFGLMAVAGLSWKAASMRRKKGATEGLEGGFLAATTSTDDKGVGFLGSGARRSLRDWTILCVCRALWSIDDEDDRGLSVLLGFVGLGEGRWLEARRSWA